MMALVYGMDSTPVPPVVETTLYGEVQRGRGMVEKRVRLENHDNALVTRWI